ncbi:hypothetical protein [Sphaerisporangium dianthi]|uniref:Uncharacterized protein n=1 Tax=Sphaerisporangium dianthi TaxID=1436120 RepID=A0ABV9CF37_9ACTN
MTEKRRVRVSWGYTRIPVSDVEGVREALQELFGCCPPFEATDERGEWLVELPSEYAGFGRVFVDAGIFNLVTRP